MVTLPLPYMTLANRLMFWLEHPVKGGKQWNVSQINGFNCYHQYPLYGFPNSICYSSHLCHSYNYCTCCSKRSMNKLGEWDLISKIHRILMTMRFKASITLASKLTLAHEHKPEICNKQQVNYWINCSCPSFESSKLAFLYARGQQNMTIRGCWWSIAAGVSGNAGK